MLGAPPKRGKSFLMGNIGLAVASGGLVLNVIAVNQRPVLYLALEDGHRRLQDRLQRMNAGQPLPAALTLVTKATPNEAIRVMAEYLQRYRQQRPLVILDTLGKIKPPLRSGQESFQADYEFGTMLKNLADDATGSTILVVHHTRKMPSEEFVDALSGTYGIAASANYVMVLDRKRHCDDAVLKVTRREIAEGECCVGLLFGGSNGGRRAD
jgi:RecA-family ATPase